MFKLCFWVTVHANRSESPDYWRQFRSTYQIWNWEFLLSFFLSDLNLDHPHWMWKWILNASKDYCFVKVFDNQNNLNCKLEIFNKIFKIPAMMIWEVGLAYTIKVCAEEKILLLWSLLKRCYEGNRSEDCLYFRATKCDYK